MTKSRSPAAKPPAALLAAGEFHWLLIGLGIVLLAAAAFIVYWPALHGGFILDDDLLLKNDLIKDPDGLHKFWFTSEAIDYWPVSNSSLWLEWRVWGANAHGYHVTNLLMHIGNSLLIWLALRRLSVPGAYFAALLFAVHPVNVESVAWVVQRKTIMAMFFFLVSILCYLKADPRESSDDLDFLDRMLWYFFSLIAFLLGGLSKGSILTLPLILLLIVWWQRDRIAEWDLLRVAPFLAITGILAIVNIWFRTHGEEAAFRHAGLVERLLGAGAIPWFYLYKALWPVDLVFIYPQWNIEVRNPLWWLPLLASIVATALLVWQRHRPWVRNLLVAWAFYWLALAPILGFVDVSYMEWSLVADHYQYIAITAVVAVVAAAIFRLVPDDLQPWVAAGVCLALTGVLMRLAYAQASIYENPETLYRVTVEKNTTCWQAYNNLGVRLLELGQTAEARQNFEHVLELNPNHAEAHYNLGRALSELGYAQESVPHFEEAIRLRPNFPEAHYNFGYVLVDLNRPHQALIQLQQAISFKPDYAEAHNNLALLLSKLGRTPEAVEHLKTAVAAQPDYTEAWANLATAFADANRPADAVAAARTALKLAREQGKTSLAAQLEVWLSAYPPAQTPGGNPTP